MLYVVIFLLLRTLYIVIYAIIRFEKLLKPWQNLLNSKTICLYNANYNLILFSLLTINKHFFDWASL